MHFYKDKNSRSEGDKIKAAVQIVDPATGKVVMIAPDVGLRYTSLLLYFLLLYFFTFLLFYLFLLSCMHNKVHSEAQEVKIRYF
jgi:hypothetical protein